MGALSDYAEGQILDHLFRTALFTKPTELHIALYTVAPTDSTAGTEVSGGSYARVQRDPDDANWDAPTSGNGKTSNLAVVTFPAPTANWGTVVAVGILDAATGGNLIAYGALAATKVVNSGDSAPSFDPGDLSISLD